ncbi:LOB domain-containing protein 22 [Vigna umbellata]|uniref:LOB domain-containing protein 22 n=1 Tax=Vigna umbellata TaxID=87088 RepID=UPI001F5E9686|nr:LOB domain-containing protein 22 [Vigna umbellata]
MQPKSHTPFFLPPQKAMNNNNNNTSTITTTNTNTNTKTNNRISSTRNGNSTTQACAACKYQRRKCAPDCILAPYFPHDRQRQFLNAHKLFGVSNITKIIKVVSPRDKDQAMRTIIYQSDMRASDPVGGCYRYIVDLQTQIEYCRAELDLVLQQLAMFRAQAQHQNQHQYQHQHGIYAPNSVNVTVNGDGEVLNADPMGLYGQPQYQCLQPHQQEQYVMMHENGSQNFNGATPLQEQMNTWAVQNTAVSLSSLSLQGQSSNVSDEYDHKAVIDIDSDERSELGFESEELVHRSDESVLFKIDDAVIKAEGDCMQQAQDHDLKGAATSFSLTNCTC